MVYDFERNRTSNKCCNDLMYVCSGLKYIFCGCIAYPPIENIPIKELIDYSGEAKQGSDESFIMSKFLFATDMSRNSDFYLKGNPISLIATNVPSFMGGKTNPWADSNEGSMHLVSPTSG